MSVYECAFCHSLMRQKSQGLAVDTWTCPTCGAVRSYGWEKLPDPDLLRNRVDDLEQLADEVENSGLASRLEGSR